LRQSREWGLYVFARIRALVAGHRGAADVRRACPVSGPARPHASTTPRCSPCRSGGLASRTCWLELRRPLPGTILRAVRLQSRTSVHYGATIVQQTSLAAVVASLGRLQSAFPWVSPSHRSSCSKELSGARVWVPGGTLHLLFLRRRAADTRERRRRRRRASSGLLRLFQYHTYCLTTSRHRSCWNLIKTAHDLLLVYIRNIVDSSQHSVDGVFLPNVQKKVACHILHKGLSYKDPSALRKAVYLFCCDLF